MNVQAFINSISFPKDLDSVYHYVTETECGFDMEGLIYDGCNNLNSNWTVPKWGQIDDVVLFFHAKYAWKTIRKLKKEFANTKESYPAEQREVFIDAFGRAENIYNLYGGKIFAIAQIADKPLNVGGSSGLHFKSRIFADIKNIHILA
jgi:hypothetical protein